MNQLGNAITALRIKKGMTQKELSEACNIDIRTIQRIEAGEVTPRMHTIKLLSNALDCDPGHFTTTTENSNTPFDKDTPFDKAIKTSFIAGIIFSFNAIPVVIDLITKSLNVYLHVLTMLVHSVSWVFFLRSFYLVGRHYKNQVLALSSLIAMVLLPLINTADLLKAWFYGTGTYILFILLCLDAIILGVGLLMEARKRKNEHRVPPYTIAGFMVIIQSSLFLSPELRIVYTGLLLSLLGNVVMTVILYMEYKHVQKPGTKNNPGPVLA